MWIRTVKLLLHPLQYRNETQAPAISAMDVEGTTASEFRVDEVHLKFYHDIFKMGTGEYKYNSAQIAHMTTNA